ncbi:MAG: aminomethyl-transferring glycine dehydrogenase subunit GcvPB [Anaerolineae bacterium]|nr:aminomethyl-transferring glycine dehydrogenase subunit GcvPB [Anaerolineae bacterium]
MSEKTLYELSRPGRTATSLPPLDVPEAPLPEEWMRDDLPLPEISEVDLVRHYMRLSQLNHAVDIGFYPLGSCTMKYNPKVNEEAAALPGFVRTHPLQPQETVQGNLQLMWELQKMLAEIGGFDAVSLQPAAGAQGEFAGILIMRSHHRERGQAHRDKILIPDSAHGTNPASTTMSGYRVVQLPSDERGNVDLEALRAQCDDTVAGLMLTNPNTLGLFDEHVEEVCRLVHQCGGLVYGDGANLNALMGVAKPGHLGFDIMHFNLHKTFSTPHGGGGPGSGPVGVRRDLAAHLPGPIVVREGDRYRLEMPEKSIGRVKSFYGNFAVMVKALTYIRMLGEEGLRDVSVTAVLAANYLQERLKKTYPLPYDRRCMHEFVLEGRIPGAPDVRALDVSKRLIDYGFHPPTNYFPLIVREALMIEPTETESRETLDAFAEAMETIAEEARSQPGLLHQAPHRAPVRRLDEVRAARELRLRWEH